MARADGVPRAYVEGARKVSKGTGINMPKKSDDAFEDLKINVKIKLSALWATVMFCYVYGDYFGLYTPGTVQQMSDGKMGPLGAATQGVLVGTSAMMAIPSLMVFLSLVLPPRVNRVLNVVLGIIYTLIILASMPGTWAYYIFFGVIEVILTLSVAWYAWKWPRLRA